MKKSILVGSAAILISMASFAQSDPLNGKQLTQVETLQNVHPDGVMMTDGTMKLVKEGQVTAMLIDITMDNGTIVQVDGTIINKDETRSKMKEGEHMDMAGVITDIKDFKKK